MGKKTTELTTVTSLDGTELIGVVQSGANKQAALNQVGKCIVDVFTSSGTWTKRTGLKSVRVYVIGGGGGGGGGIGVSSTESGGGCGGGGAGYSFTDIPAAGLGSTETVTVGAGGAGGADSVDGSDGGSSSFSSVLASGGTGGIYANNLSAVFSGQGGAGMLVGMNGFPGYPNNGSDMTVVGPVIQYQSDGWRICAGGGSAGSGGSNTTSYAGQSIVAHRWVTGHLDYGYDPSPSSTITAGGASSGGAGSTSWSFATTYLPGGGGTGGGGHSTGNGGHGGAGGLYGGGGGGGGGTVTGHTSGTGGNGAAGVVVVYNYF